MCPAKLYKDPALSMDSSSSSSSCSMTDTRWKHPFSAIVAGPSGCGKSNFVKNFLRHGTSMCDTRFSRVIWYFDEWQPLYDGDKSIEYREGLPQHADYEGDKKPKLLVIDDLMREASNNVVVDLFTKVCHHKNLSVFYITQNLFHKGNGQRDISLNANYIVFFKNPRDRAQIQHLARQVYPEDPRFLQEAYHDATAAPHGYLLFDLKQSTPENCRFRSNIFPSDDNHYVYVPRKDIKVTNAHRVPVVQL
ncbi:uncharacterized protein LOC124183690 [Neodiprion fabricii]|uniref:uncharacterized protein LOC124183690 n=1 Tax=Neodiprion fabricii TaxID=2872261 RepID=UPI001ED92E1F|nr:uncharacterized protein LOC124183690 [Neodiprion fabricii]